MAVPFRAIGRPTAWTAVVGSGPDQPVHGEERELRTRNWVSIGVFSQLATVSPLSANAVGCCHRHARRAALESDGGQARWPVLTRQGQALADATRTARLSPDRTRTTPMITAAHGPYPRDCGQQVRAT